MASGKNPVNLSGTQWRHFKGNKYFILLEAKHASDESNQFVYVELQDNNPLSRWLLRELLKVISTLIKDDIWVRSEEEFLGLGERDGLKMPRFRRLD